MKKISGFQGDYRFLSNFWPCYIMYRDLLYPSTEHAYQATKVQDIQLKTRIRDCQTPAEAKEFFDTHAIKPGADWPVEKKLLIMEELLTIKFGGNAPFLTRALLATGEASLVEENNWGDSFWGVCNNTGENNLGLLLMKIRGALLQQKEQIILALAQQHSLDAIAESLSITRRMLYEKMMAFKIQNEEFWIS